jgi:hypothetical protein
MKQNETRATATATPAPTSATLSALDRARLFFLHAMWDDFKPETRADLQDMVNAWNALDTDGQTPELKEGIYTRLEAMTAEAFNAEASRLACFNGAELFRELFGADIPATSSTKETPKAERARVLSAVSAPVYRPRFKEDGTMEIRITARPVKVRDILKAKTENMKNARADKHAEKSDPETAWRELFPMDIENAILTAIVYAEKRETNAETPAPINARATRAIEAVNATFAEGTRNPFTLNSKTAVQEQVRALVAIVTGSAELATAWTKRTAGNLYAELFKIEHGAEVGADILNGAQIMVEHAHMVKHGRVVVLDGAGIHTAEKSPAENPNIIR